VAAQPAVNTRGDWLENNQKLIVGVVAGLVVIAAAIFLYRTFIAAPQQAEANQQLWRAQQAFEQDSFQKALTLPAPGYLGLLDIIDEYGSTPAGNLASYYAGVSYLHLGQHQAAIDYLKAFDAEGEILPSSKLNALGDAHAQLGQLDEARDYYEDALAEAEGNHALAPYLLKKLGLMSERDGDKAAAHDYYSRLQSEYAESSEARDIEKFILRTNP